MTIANAGVILGLACTLTGDASYSAAAESVQNYLLGRNPNGVCYVTGYGTVSPLNPHHRPSMAAKQAMKGMLVGGVNSNLEDSAAKAYLANVPSAKRYVDHSESYSTNEIAIYWNSPLIYLLSLTDGAEAYEIMGDVNVDGSFTMTDIVKMQKYLTSKGTLASMRNGDINKDNRLTAMDLTMMKNLMKAGQAQ